MLSRIFWVGITGIALIVGMVLQDGDSILSWHDHRDVSPDRDRAIEAKVDRAIEDSFDKGQLAGPDGLEIDLPAETKRAMAQAVGELVKAEAEVAVARVGEEDEGAVREATARRDRARQEVDRLKAEIKGYERTAQRENDALREQVRREVKEEVRETVRDAIRN